MDPVGPSWTWLQRGVGFSPSVWPGWRTEQETESRPPCSSGPCAWQSSLFRVARHSSGSGRRLRVQPAGPVQLCQRAAHRPLPRERRATGASSGFPRGRSSQVGGTSSLGGLQAAAPHSPSGCRTPRLLLGLSCAAIYVVSTTGENGAVTDRRKCPHREEGRNASPPRDAPKRRPRRPRAGRAGGRRGRKLDLETVSPGKSCHAWSLTSPTRPGLGHRLLLGCHRTIAVTVLLQPRGCQRSGSPLCPCQHRGCVHPRGRGGAPLRAKHA